MTPRQNLIKRLDDIVSDIVIERDGRCMICGSTFNLTCGHFIDRKHMATRFSLVNCNAICAKCNGEDDQKLYRLKMHLKYGKELTDKIEEAGKTIEHFSMMDLKDVLSELRQVKNR